MKTTKGGKVMNPTDAYRKELRKKELKRNKKERKKVRDVGILKKDPQQIIEQIQKFEIMKAEGALDKARKHKKRQLEDTLNLVLKKRKEFEDKMKEKGETSVMFSHLGPPRRRTTAEDEERVKHPKPEDSVYYHPTLNPTGAPPPGKPPMYKSLSGPRMPLSGESSDAVVSSSQTEDEDASIAVPPLPPPPPLPSAAKTTRGDGSTAPVSLPLPPPPPMPPKPATTSSGLPLPLPPPPGPPPRDQFAIRPLPPPPPLPQAVQPAPPGTTIGDRDRDLSALPDDLISKELPQVPTVLPPPPPSSPPPGMQPKWGSNESESAPSELDTSGTPASDDLSKLLPPPPPPPRQQPTIQGPAMLQNVQPDVLPPGISHFAPPPPPPDMRGPLSGRGLPVQAAHPGMMVPLIPRPPYGPPPGPPPVMRLPFPSGPLPVVREDDLAPDRPPAEKPSYVKSAASTVVKRPLAQHQPELTSMVPASVRVRRENAASKPKPKSSVSTAAAATKPISPVVVRPESSNSTSAPKPQGIDDSYMAFLEDMKALGALDS